MSGTLPITLSSRLNLQPPPQCADLTSRNHRRHTLLQSKSIIPSCTHLAKEWASQSDVVSVEVSCTSTQHCTSPGLEYRSAFYPRSSFTASDTLVGAKNPARQTPPGEREQHRGRSLFVGPDTTTLFGSAFEVSLRHTHQKAESPFRSLPLSITSAARRSCSAQTSMHHEITRKGKKDETGFPLLLQQQPQPLQIANNKNTDIQQPHSPNHARLRALM